MQVPITKKIFINDEMKLLRFVIFSIILFHVTHTFPLNMFTNIQKIGNRGGHWGYIQLKKYLIQTFCKHLLCCSLLVYNDSITIRECNSKWLQWYFSNHIFFNFPLPPFLSCFHIQTHLHFCVLLYYAEFQLIHLKRKGNSWNWGWNYWSESSKAHSWW